MSQNRSGGCLCGAIRYTYTGQPLRTFLCHCVDCQKANGSAFTAGLVVPREALNVTGPAPAGYTKTADSGNWIRREFCPNCGGALFTQLQRVPDVVILKVGSLDDPSQFKPGEHIWCHAEWDWARIDDGVPRYPQSKP